MVCNNIGELIGLIKKTTKKILIVGAGENGKLFFDFLQLRNIDVYAFVDKNADTVFQGKIVNSYERASHMGDAVFILSSYLYQKEMKETLLSYGVSEEMIIDFYDRTVINQVTSEVIDIKKYTEKIRELKDAYKNERCFIIGNGPSLSISDLELLQGEKSFGVNGIYGLYEKTKWRPTFYCAQDTIFCRDTLMEKVPEICKESSAAFFRVAGSLFYRYCNSNENIYFFNGIAVDDIYAPNEYPFSEECDRTVYVGDTVLYVVCQLAVYMGFKDIYFLGVDGGYLTEKKGDDQYIVQVHNSDIDINVFSKKTEILSRKSFDRGMSIWNKMNMNFLSVMEYEQKISGVHFYNATRGGILECFERVNLDELLKS